MKELWLMCKTSLYCNFIAQNEQRINDGEIDIMFFPSDAYPFNTSRLPLDLHDEIEMTESLNSAFGQRERLQDLFTELADLDTSRYDKIGIYIDHSANDLMFGNMMHYFVDADINIRMDDREKDFILPAEDRQCAEENYKEAVDSTLICAHVGEDIRFISGDMLAKFVFNNLHEDFCSIDEMVKTIKKEIDPADDFNPLFVTNVLMQLVAIGVAKAIIQDHQFTTEEILDVTEQIFLDQAMIRIFNEEEEREWKKEVNEKKKMQGVA